ncbi:MAG TPA: acyl-CoA dehydrogenase family protein [Polyangiaceae bacterium]|jgi:alkylation response protein AidB-like acyl-CoA dehydrogenase
MMTATAVNVSDWLGRLRGLAPTIEKWRDAAEQERRLPRPLFEALRQADVFKMSTPLSEGGDETDEVTALRVLEELSRQDGSVGWNAMVASNTAIIASYLSSTALQEVYRGGPSTVTAGALLPKGSAAPTPGGFRLSGRWTLASGCHQAEWMVACSMVMVGGAPRMRADGRPDVRAFFVPMRECEILDTWRTAGLRGTGSHDCQGTDLLVPEERTFAILYDGEGERGALFVKDFAAYAVARVAAVPLGIARDAIESFVALAKSKTPTVATCTLAAQHAIHERVGRAEALVRAGRALLYETVRALPYTPTWSSPLTDDQRAAIRLAGAHAAENAAAAVDLMFNAAGTSGVYTSSRLERCFRDVHVANQHVNVAPSNIEMVGQHQLGLGLHFRR